MSDPQQRGPRAARQFHQLACAELAARGLRPTFSAVARIVGVRPQHYHASVSGTRPISVEQVARWLAAWETKGWAPLRLVLTSSATTVEPTLPSDSGP